MKATFLTDEHVPSVFITTLRSNGHTVLTAKDIFGEETDDQELLHYCSKHDYVLITHDKKDFTKDLGNIPNRAGIMIYTNPVFFRDLPEEAVRTIERVFEFYSQKDLRGERIWIAQWRQFEQ